VVCLCALKHRQLVLFVVLTLSDTRSATGKLEATPMILSFIASLSSPCLAQGFTKRFASDVRVQSYSGVMTPRSVWGCHITCVWASLVRTDDPSEAAS